jgi:hypothetical protein
LAGLTAAKRSGEQANIYVCRLPRFTDSSLTNADDRLSFTSFARVQGCDGIVEGRDLANVRP